MHSKNLLRMSLDGGYGYIIIWQAFVLTNRVI